MASSDIAEILSGSNMIKIELPQIIWLASYPKSGNTWLRVLLINLLYGELKNVEDLEWLIPDIHNGLKLEQCIFREKMFVKNHLMLNEKLPFLESTKGFIYLVRNPLDVAVSHLNYCFLTSNHLFQNLNKKQLNRVTINYFDDFIKNRGDKRWLERGIGSWQDNVESWLENKNGFSHLIIKYEDLLLDPHKEVRRICKFIQVDADKEIINHAIESSSFTKMKQLENDAIHNKKNGIFYQPDYEPAHQKGLRFLNLGTAGQAKIKLSPQQLEYANEVFSPLMQKLGYCVKTPARIT